MSDRAQMLSLEQRRLLSFAQLDPTFGSGGVSTFSVPDQGSAVASSPLSPLSSGGSMVAVSDREFRRFDANGKADLSYGGGDGVLTVNAKNRALLLAVDPGSGRLAMIAANGTAGALKLNFYSAAGALERSLADSSLSIDLLKVGAMAFDRQGRLLLASTATNTLTRVLPKQGRLDGSFGINGLATLPSIPNGATRSTPYFGATGFDERLFIGANDQITLTRAYLTTSGATTNRFFEAVRFDVNGKPVLKFDGKGFVSVYGGYYTVKKGIGYTKMTSVVDLAAAPDGSLILLQSAIANDSTSPYVSDSNTHYAIQQIRDDGTLANPIGLDGQANLMIGQPLSVNTDDKGRIYIAGQNQIIRLDTHRRFDAAYNGTDGAAAITANSSYTDATVDARGRLLTLGSSSTLAGTSSTALTLRAFSGSTESFGSPSGQATRLADGTLDIAGTSKNDKVRLTMVNGALQVTINKTVATFALKKLSGLLIHTGNGDDNIKVDPSVIAFVRIQGGAGNDWISGSNFYGMIDGGAGNDYLEGGDGGDVILGGDGNDTLRGNFGGDRLWGQGGDDVLWAEDDVGKDDAATNVLVGGAGADRIVQSIHRAVNGVIRKDVLGTDDQDTIV